MESKLWRKCNTVRDLTEFFKQKKTKDGRRTVCKHCVNKLNQSRLNDKPWLKHLYKATSRCNDPNVESYPAYGGRGIKILLTIEQMKYLWDRDKAHLLKEPSIDRIDSDGNYCLENCRFIEVLENKQLASTSQRKPIIQTSTDGEFIREWESNLAIVKELDYHSGCISYCCNGKMKTYKGCLWKFK